MAKTDVSVGSKSIIGASFGNITINKIFKGSKQIWPYEPPITTGDFVAVSKNFSVYSSHNGEDWTYLSNIKDSIVDKTVLNAMNGRLTATNIVYNYSTNADECYFKVFVVCNTSMYIRNVMFYSKDCITWSFKYITSNYIFYPYALSNYYGDMLYQGNKYYAYSTKSSYISYSEITLTNSSIGGYQAMSKVDEYNVILNMYVDNYNHKIVKWNGCSSPNKLAQSCYINNIYKTGSTTKIQLGYQAGNYYCMCANGRYLMLSATSTKPFYVNNSFQETNWSTYTSPVISLLSATGKTSIYLPVITYFQNRYLAVANSAITASSNMFTWNAQLTDLPTTYYSYKVAQTDNYCLFYCGDKAIYTRDANTFKVITLPDTITGMCIFSNPLA